MCMDFSAQLYCLLWECMAQRVYLAIASSRIKLEIRDLDHSISYSLDNIMFIFINICLIIY